jgi:hypothetical protein
MLATVWALLAIGLLPVCLGDFVAPLGDERRRLGCHWSAHLKRTVCDDGKSYSLDAATAATTITTTGNGERSNSEAKGSSVDTTNPSSIGASHGLLGKTHVPAQPAAKLKPGDHCMSAPHSHTNARGA